MPTSCFWWRTRTTELIFLGGAIPTYAVEQQRKVVVVYMTYSNTTRRSELLNGLWAMGMRQYPVMGEFWDKYSKSMDAVADAWGLKKANTFVVEAVRKYKPKVIVTQDFKRRVRPRRAYGNSESR